MPSKAQQADFESLETIKPNDRSRTPSSFTELLEEPPKYVSTLPRSLNRPVPGPITSTASELQFADYRLPLSTVSEDKTTCTTTASQITSDPDVLHEFLRQQLRMPPRPVVRVLGTHPDWCYSWGNTKVDFDLMMDMTPLICSTARPNDTASLVYCTAAVGDLATEVKNFCYDDGDCKVFTIERQVTGWDTNFLEQKIRGLIESTMYRGDVAVTFPVTNSRVQVLKGLPSDVQEDRSQPSAKSKWYKRRKPAGQSVNEEEPLTRALEKAHKHAYIDVKWPYSKDNEDSSLQDAPTTPIRSTRQYTAQSEQDWWTVWEEPIKNCILRDRQCWVTLEDWKDVVMGLVQIELPAKTWGTSADDWAAALKSMKWSDRQAARQYLCEAGLKTESGSRKMYLPGIAGI